MIEPTEEFGYGQLEVVQRFTGVTYTTSELDVVTRLYLARKSSPADPFVRLRLDQVRDYVWSGRVDRARALLDAVE